MRRWIGFFLSWLLSIKPIARDVFAGQGGMVIYTNNGGWPEVLLMHFLLPADIVFFLPSGFADNCGIVTSGRRIIATPGMGPSQVKQMINLLREGKKVLLFPGKEQIFNLSRLVALLSYKTGAVARPIFVDVRNKAGRLKVGEEVGAAVYNPSAAAYKFYDGLQSALFWARHQEQANLFDQLLVARRKFGAGKIVAEDFNGSIDYRKLIIGSYILGGKFRELCGNEERVGTLLPTAAGHFITFFALCYLGKTPAILNFSSGAATVSECAELAEVKCIITSRLFVEKAELQPLIEKLQNRCRIIYLEDVKETVTLKDKVAGILRYLWGVKAARHVPARVVLFTSGSESKPKGVVLSHGNLVTNVEQITSVINISTGDKMFNALPIFHSFGLTGGMILPVLSGVEVYLYPSPLHYKVIPELIAQKKATVLLGTPTFLMGYAKNAGVGDFNTLRYVIAGGEKLKEEIRAFWRQNYAINILEAYGTTEAAPALCVSSPQFNKPGSVGRFLPGVQWRIQEVEGISDGGNLLIKGPNLMEGYILHGKGFVPVDEWYDCGDVISVDEEGYCTIKARLKRFAKISGEMVSLNQVEEAAEGSFSTDMNAAVSTADLKKGEIIILFTTKPDATKQQIREYLSRQQLSMLLMPEDIIIVEELPVLGSGKIDYVKLQAMAADLN
jgi:acyl-[acyl-carrier-protein]-phospholipid O-acyltransferase/long-chain-fatty-acid--[acyl-carrier-protein] ligase